METAWTAACRPSRKGGLLLRSGGGSKSLEKRSNITRFSSFSKDAGHSLFYIKVSKFLKPAFKKGLCAGPSYQGCGPEPARGPPTRCRGPSSCPSELRGPGGLGAVSRSVRERQLCRSLCCVTLDKTPSFSELVWTLLS